ncbi:DUF4272 domain-containing protein [Microlunatus parietis]|uniref:Uncharacterized protein n=1 Tax=Microlunatus parietis TaxID=682979 RepID=A0A7Y9I324_9ACTN|nr:DUF4272 domain-containing protein [Microlunatus parietis]NYE69019.1 hypothetical protein [Microlunatus parietis]
MVTNAAVYARFGWRLEAPHWQALVPPGVECAVDLAEDGSSVTFASPEGTITFNRLADDKVGPHLLGLERYLRGVGASDGLLVRALSTSAVYGSVADRDLGKGLPGQLMLDLTDRTGGFCFLDGRLFIDCDGRDLVADPLRPDRDRVVRRALVLLATMYRSAIEAGIEEHPDLMKDEEGRYRAWLDGVDLGAEPEPDERDLLDQPAGAVGEDVAAEHAFDAEAALTLLWALGVADTLPALDPARQPLDTLIEYQVPGPGPFDGRRPDPSLRPDDVIDCEWRRQQAIHWRLADLQLARRHVDFAAWAQDTWFGAVDLDGITLIDGDLAVAGTPVSALDDRASWWLWRQVAERNRALNWLIGANPIYGAVGTPT